nr:hypothetical protein CFP56_00715 [Quercus suber]
MVTTMGQDDESATVPCPALAQLSAQSWDRVRERCPGALPTNSTATRGKPPYRDSSRGTSAVVRCVEVSMILATSSTDVKRTCFRSWARGQTSGHVRGIQRRALRLARAGCHIWHDHFYRATVDFPCTRMAGTIQCKRHVANPTGRLVRASHRAMPVP